MNCRRFKKLLSAFLDGELGSDIQGRVREHLRLCRPCARLVEAYRTGVKALGGSTELDPPADLFESVMSAVSPRPQPYRKAFELRSFIRPRVLAPALAAAVVALVFTMTPEFGIVGDGNRGNFAAVDSTMDMINFQVAEQLAGKETSREKRAVRLASYNWSEDEAVLSDGVSRNPVIVLSGVSEYGE